MGTLLRAEFSYGDRVESVPTGVGGGAVRLLTAPHLSKGGAVGAEGRDFGMTLALTPGPSPIRWERGTFLGAWYPGLSDVIPLGYFIWGVVPRVARSSQPWAIFRNPFGILKREFISFFVVLC